ncbi:MAG: hypothetical protein Q7K57_17215 [Burkholderiaceae bacterium]|nr:hypothetical protein [Burkholderiaceae bacterium]
MIERRREKLHVIFRLDSELDQDEIQIGTNTLGQLVRVGGISDIQALRTIIDTMRKFGVTELNDHGKQISADSYLKKVEKQGKWSRSVDAGGMSFRFGHVVALKHSFISVEEITTGSAVSWADWVEPFLAVDGFVQAWLSDVDYDYWQNAKDPLQYQAVGRNYSSLPMKSNGLPPPLEQMEIDTSSNPGRWSLQSGYVEAIGATMWLGMPFWESVGENHKDALLSEDGFTVRSVGRDILQVVASEQCFFDEATKDKQNTLRAVLYGQSQARPEQS